MKKIITMFMVLLISSTMMNAQSMDEDLIKKAQAIVAYQMNLVSLKEHDKTLYEQFKQHVNEDSPTLDSIGEFFANNKKLSNNLSLLKEIKTLKPNAVTKDALVSFYSDSIFEKTNKGSEFNKFLKKRKGDSIDDIKKKIKKQLEKLDLYNKEEQIVSVPADKENENNENEPMEEKNSGSVLAILIPCLLLAGAVAAAVLLFKQNKELKKKVADSVKERGKRNDELSNKENEIQKLKEAVHRLENQCQELSKSRDEVEEFYQGLLNSRERKEPEKKIREEKEDVQDAGLPKEYFMRSPKGGMFDEGTTTYRPGKALYKIVSADDMVGTFEYINTPEAVEYARQSKSSFIEPACTILNDGEISISQIVTEQKGKVKRVDNGWKIIEKANVRLM